MTKAASKWINTFYISFKLMKEQIYKIHYEVAIVA